MPRKRKTNLGRLTRKARKSQLIRKLQRMVNFYCNTQVNDTAVNIPSSDSVFTNSYPVRVMITPLPKVKVKREVSTDSQHESNSHMDAVTAGKNNVALDVPVGANRRSDTGNYYNASDVPESVIIKEEFDVEPEVFNKQNIL